MRSILFVPLLCIFAFGDDVVTKKTSPPTSVQTSFVLLEKKIDRNRDSLTVFFSSDSIYFELKNGKTITLTSYWGKEQKYPNKILEGLFLTDDVNHLVSQSMAFYDGILYCAVSDLLNRGQLYTVDFKEKTIVRDDHFQRDYIVSQTGLFIVSQEENEVMAIGKSELDRNGEDLITPITIYAVSKGKYKMRSKTTIKGELEYSNSLLNAFIRKYTSKH